MDLSSYYQSVFYQSREYVPCVYSVCGEMYTQNSPVYNCPSTLSPESDSYESDSFSPQFNTSPPCSQTKLPRIPPLAVLQQRRLAANARERKRANKINFAFNRLRKALPGFQDREISKYEAIQLAQDYIKQLVKVLETDVVYQTDLECGQNNRSK